VFLKGCSIPHHRPAGAKPNRSYFDCVVVGAAVVGAAVVGAAVVGAAVVGAAVVGHSLQALHQLIEHTLSQLESLANPAHMSGQPACVFSSEDIFALVRRTAFCKRAKSSVSSFTEQVPSPAAQVPLAEQTAEAKMNVRRIEDIATNKQIRTTVRNSKRGSFAYLSRPP
jgi:hypothetical protein